MSPAARRIVQVLASILLSGVILFGAAGRLDWGWAWACLGVFIAVILVNAVVLLPRHTDLIAERGRAGPGAKRWDKWLGGSASIVGSFATILVAGLDERWGWTPPLPPGVHVGGLIALVAGYALVSWAMAVNRFFSTIVRIQKDRGHSVVDRGPYAVVRHPGYVGLTVAFLALPLLLGSAWTLIAALVAVGLLIARTAMEDRTLREELDGYRAYAARVRYRLCPGIW